MNYEEAMGRGPATQNEGWWSVDEVDYVTEMSVGELTTAVNTLLVQPGAEHGGQRWQPAGEFQAYEVAYRGAITTTFTQKMVRWAWNTDVN